MCSHYQHMLRHLNIMQPTIVTIVIFIILGCIMYSLSYGLFYLLRGRGQSKRTVKGLTVRIGLSMALFLMLLLALYNGWITPNPAPF